MHTQPSIFSCLLSSTQPSYCPSFVFHVSPICCYVFSSFLRGGLNLLMWRQVLLPTMDSNDPALQGTLTEAVTFKLRLSNLSLSHIFTASRTDRGGNLDK